MPPLLVTGAAECLVQVCGRSLPVVEYRRTCVVDVCSQRMPVSFLYMEIPRLYVLRRRWRVRGHNLAWQAHACNVVITTLSRAIQTLRLCHTHALRNLFNVSQLSSYMHTTGVAKNQTCMILGNNALAKPPAESLTAAPATAEASPSPPSKPLTRYLTVSSSSRPSPSLHPCESFEISTLC